MKIGIGNSKHMVEVEDDMNIELRTRNVRSEIFNVDGLDHV